MFTRQASVLGLITALLACQPEGAITPDGPRSKPATPDAQARRSTPSPSVVRPAVGHPNPIPQSHSLDFWLVGALGISSMGAMIAIVTSFYLYEWRRRLAESPHLAVPDAHGKHLRALADEVKTIGAQAARLGTSLNDVLETTMTLQAALDQRDKEIARLRKGYDSQIFRRFLLRFIRVDQAVRELAEEDGGSRPEVAQIARLLEDALEECGLERFSPVLGSDSRTTEGLADRPRIVAAEDPTQDHKIAQVIEPGFLLRSEGHTDVILPAKVAVYLSQGKA